MASILRIKRSELSGNPAVLGAGELAYSALLDNGSNGGDRLYVGTGTESAGNAVNHVVIGGKFFTDMVSAATSVGTNNTIVKRNGANTAFLNITGNVTGDIYASNGTYKVLESGTDGSDSTFYGTVAGNANTATTAVTVTGAAQTAITSVGTLTGLTLSGAITGAVVGNVIPFYYANQAAFPSATTYHGALAHSNADSRMYFAHSGAWAPLANSSDATSTNTASATVTRDASGNFSAGTITAALAGNATTATTLATAHTIAITGDIAYTSQSFNGSVDVTGAATLATVLDGTLGKVHGAFGSTTSIPVVTVNAKGLVIGITTAAVATTLKVIGSIGTEGSLDLLNDTLTVSAGSGLKTSFNNTTNDLKIELDGTASLTQLNLTGTLAAGSISTTGTITADGDIEGFNFQINGDTTIEGNLWVKGVTTTVNSTTVTIADKNLQLAPAANSDVLADSGGLLVGVNNTGTGFIAPSLVYTQSNNRWNFNKDLVVPNVHGALVGNASTASAWASARTFSFALGDVSGNFATDGSLNVSNIALTLATVNGGAGAGTQYGSSTSVPVFTVNSKGLVTASSSSAIPTATVSVNGLASFDVSQFLVTNGAVSIVQVDGGAY